MSASHDQLMKVLLDVRSELGELKATVQGHIVHTEQRLNSQSDRLNAHSTKIDKAMESRTRLRFAVALLIGIPGASAAMAGTVWTIMQIVGT